MHRATQPLSAPNIPNLSLEKTKSKFKIAQAKILKDLFIKGRVDTDCYSNVCNSIFD